MQVIVDCEILKNQETGVEKYTTQLIRHLAGQVDLKLLHNSYVSHPFFSQYETVCLKRVKFPTARTVYAMLMPPKIDSGILHAPTPVTPMWRKPKCKLIVTVHDLTPLQFPHYHNLRRRIYFRTILRQVIRIADEIISVSHSTKDDILSYFSLPADKISVIHQSSEMQPRYEKLPAKYGIDEDYILYVGTVEPRKNLLRLMDAYNQLKTDVKLVIVGAYGWKNKAVYEEKNPNIVFTGYVPEEDLPVFYTNAKFFIYPSMYEGFGIPILEAMNCHCPVITSNISSMPEVAGDAALLVDPYSVEEIKNAMAKLLQDDDLRRRMIAAGVERAKNFSWKKTAEKTIAVYHKALG